MVIFRGTVEIVEREQVARPSSIRHRGSSGHSDMTTATPCRLLDYFYYYGTGMAAISVVFAGIWPGLSHRFQRCPEPLASSLSHSP